MCERKRKWGEGVPHALSAGTVWDRIPQKALKLVMLLHFWKVTPTLRLEPAGAIAERGYLPHASMSLVLLRFSGLLLRLLKAVV